MEKPLRSKEWLWFMLFGPPIGGMIFISQFVVDIPNLIAYIAQGKFGLPSWLDLLDLLKLLGFISIFSYIFGLLPATIVGVLACYLRELKRFQYIAALSTAGGALALICGFWIENKHIALFAFAAGAISAALIAAWLRRHEFCRKFNAIE